MVQSSGWYFCWLEGITHYHLSLSIPPLRTPYISVRTQNSNPTNSQYALLSMMETSHLLSLLCSQSWTWISLKFPAVCPVSLSSSSFLLLLPLLSLLASPHYILVDQYHHHKTRMKFFVKFASEKNFDPLVAKHWYQVSDEDIKKQKVNSETPSTLFSTLVFLFFLLLVFLYTLILFRFRMA